MSASTSSNRKGHYACDFCRVRKLRCNRPLPCTNCVSRRKTCHIGRITTTPPQPQQPHSAGPPAPPPPQQPAVENQGSLLAEVQALKQRVQGLEARVSQSASPGHGVDSSLSRSPSRSGDMGMAPTTPSAHVQMSNVVAHLERVSMGQSSHDSIYVDDLAFKVEPIRAVPRDPTYTAQLGKPTRCVLLPRHEETRVLLGKFVNNISYIYHVVHHPSLPSTIDDVYQQIDGQKPLKPGHLALLLSIVASVTHVWTQHDDVDCEGSLFSSSAQANTQTPLWIKSTLDVLNVVQSGPPLALEAVQGIIILSFLICNLEGVSLRYRSLISMGLLLGRELGLHRIDRDPNAAAANSIQAEMGRRVWWYLVATDWLLAARHGGPGEGVYQANPRHMAVSKPRNINDVDLLDNGLHPQLPISHPTDMSYFLQRVRLAEISRGIVDHNHMAGICSEGPSHYAHATDMDFELDRMIQDIPSFFDLDSYDCIPGSKASGIFIQAYMLNSVIHTQRCKLHLTYLTSGPNNTSAYASSREKCLRSARQLIRAETQLENAQHPFVRIRLRLSGILYGVFMASIVLLIDACVNRTCSLQDEIYHGEVAEALRMVENARGYSLAAANLHESLKQVLANHRAQQQQQQLQRQQTPVASIPLSLEETSAPATAAPVMNTPNVHQSPDLLGLANPTHTVAREVDRGSHMATIPNQLPAASSQPAYDMQLAESLEELMDMDGFQWDDLFSDLGSSSFL